MAETITAISTAPGEGGIGIVRVSGPASEIIMRSVMKDCPKDIKARHAYMSKVIDEKSEIIDEAVFLFMKAPASYTGEDMLEIQAHGSNVSLKEILSTVLKCKANGIRMAEPGEFTKLAFLNGKMDLSQAEAVIDIIKAKSDLSLEIAESQHEGRLSLSIKEIRKNILNILAKMAVDIDYPDEDIAETLNIELINTIKDVKKPVRELINTSKIGKIAREGIKIAIIGKPNVGKSSLMNAMLGEGRAIVTEIPGTTRDTVEENVTIGGIPAVLIDTAGLRETDDFVEKIGIERAENIATTADIIALVLDGSKQLDEQDSNIIEFIKKINNKNVLVIVNKTDLGSEIKESDIKRALTNSRVIKTSLLGIKSNEAVREISEAIGEMLELGNINPGESNIISNERHIALLNEANDNLDETIKLLENDEPTEVAELSLRYAYNLLGNIIGEEVGDEILDTVFSKFCLGK